MAKRYQVRPRTPKTWTVDGWRGMYDTRSVKGETDGDAPILINLIPTDPARGGGVYLRPGRERLGRASTAPQLGSGAHVVQWIGEVTLNAIGTKTIAVADGEIWQVNPDVGTVTKLVSTANLATASITLHPSIAVIAANFDGKLILAAYNNPPTGLTPNDWPFQWDGSTGSSGLTKLLNGPNCALAFAVYYAKLFMLKVNAKTIVWSEEGDATTGYESGGFNNAWDLTQTTNEPLTALIGTNEALYYGRKTSVGAIRGAATSTFQTDGVHDSVHIGSGPYSSAFFNYVAGTLTWMDDKGSVYAYRGGEVTKPSDQMPRLYGMESLDGQSGNVASLPVYGAGEEGFAGLPGRFLVADTSNQRVYAEFCGVSGERWVQVYDAESLKLLCLWRFTSNNSRHLSGNPNIYMPYCVGRGSLGSLYITTDDSGNVFQQLIASPSTTPSTSDDAQTSTSAAITGVLIGPMHGWSTNIEWQFDRIDLLIDVPVGYQGTVRVLTSRRNKYSQAYVSSFLASGVSNTPYEKHLPFGLNTNGRWARPVIEIVGSTSTSSGSEPPQLFGYSITGYPVSAAPVLT